MKRLANPARPVAPRLVRDLAVLLPLAADRAPGAIRRHAGAIGDPALPAVDVDQVAPRRVGNRLTSVAHLDCVCFVVDLAQCPIANGSIGGEGGTSVFLRQAMFADRAEAGRGLARRLTHLADERPVVLALPRGGVPVGFEIASALRAPLDLVLVRKIGAPFQPELAIGAVVDGGRPETVIHQEMLRDFQIPDAYIAEQSARQLAEIERRRELYLAGRERAPVEGRTAILVDDGIATGATMEAALRATRRARPRRLVLAVPVAPPDTIEELRPHVDEVVCLATPRQFGAIGAFYDDFRQLGDDEVIDLLQRAMAFANQPSATSS